MIKNLLTLHLVFIAFLCNAQMVQIRGLVFFKHAPTDLNSNRYLNHGDTVKLIQLYDDFMKIEHKGVTGFVVNGSFQENEVYKTFIANNKPTKFIDYAAIAAEKKRLNDRLKRFVPKYGNSMGTLVAKKMIQLGMTKAMVTDSWGEPDDINRTVASWGVHEQWVYGSSTYVYFENGKLTSWQD